ncbi:phage minor capsid protein [Streptomyces malaysiensis]|uniref:phage minor capsid protein n=1 Tax=Streptomyces malaysiensis TaxID=92644 RepID=UPI002B30F95E|nr:hypothetical protein R8789_10825 [Streptomyces malaysiensis]
MAIHPGVVEPLAERTRDLYAAAELRLLGNIARQLADGLDAPGWAEHKLTSVTALRRSAQGVVDELGKAVCLDVFDAIAEAYNTGHRAAVAELGSLPDRARQLVDEITPNAQAVDLDHPDDAGGHHTRQSYVPRVRSSGTFLGRGKWSAALS